MILIIWAVFFIISITFIILGYTYNSTISDVLLVVGWSLIFLIGAVMCFGSLTHKTAESEIINYTYGQYNFTHAGENITEVIILSQTVLKNNTYTQIPAETGFLNSAVNLHTIGFFIMITGLLGAIFFWIDVPKRKDGVDDD